MANSKHILLGMKSKYLKSAVLVFAFLTCNVSRAEDDLITIIKESDLGYRPHEYQIPTCARELRKCFFRFKSQPHDTLGFLIFDLKHKTSWFCFDTYKANDIYEVRKTEVIHYEVPKPTYELMKKYRPDFVNERFFNPSMIEELVGHIGVFQIWHDQLWFGISFYDAERLYGVGGIGQFDFETKKFNIIRFKEIGDWSCSAFYIDDKYIGVGLYHFGEAPTAGGLLLYNRKNQKVKTYPLKAEIKRIYLNDNNFQVKTTSGTYKVFKEKEKLIKIK